MKFQKVLERYDDLYSMDMFGESTEGHKYRTPFYSVKKDRPKLKRRYGTDIKITMDNRQF